MFTNFWNIDGKNSFTLIQKLQIKLSRVSGFVIVAFRRNKCLKLFLRRKVPFQNVVWEKRFFFFFFFPSFNFCNVDGPKKKINKINLIFFEKIMSAGPRKNIKNWCRLSRYEQSLTKHTQPLMNMSLYSEYEIQKWSPWWKLARTTPSVSTSNVKVARNVTLAHCDNPPCLYRDLSWFWVFNIFP